VFTLKWGIGAQAIDTVRFRFVDAGEHSIAGSPRSLGRIGTVFPQRFHGHSSTVFHHSGGASHCVALLNEPKVVQRGGDALRLDEAKTQFVDQKGIAVETETRLLLVMVVEVL
jgi:hypothetical protein